MRLLLIGSGAVSAVMLLWTVTLALLGLGGRGTPAALPSVALGAATVSILTHILATLRLWARR